MADDCASFPDEQQITAWKSFLESNEQSPWPYIQASLRDLRAAISMVELMKRIGFSGQLSCGYFSILPDNLLRLICEHLTYRGAFKSTCKHINLATADIPPKAQNVFTFMFENAAPCISGEVRFSTEFDFGGLKWCVALVYVNSEFQRQLQLGHKDSSSYRQRASLFLVCRSPHKLPWSCLFTLAFVNHFRMAQATVQ